MIALQEIRAQREGACTAGLPDDVILRFASRDPDLGRAVEEAVRRHRELRAEFPDLPSTRRRT
jgi:hypothetical protein